jgi:hypothetical protein
MAEEKIKNSKDVDEEWPKEGRDYDTVDGQWFWKHEKIPMDLKCL